jgi:hypothetical protein
VPGDEGSAVWAPADPRDRVAPASVAELMALLIGDTHVIIASSTSNA